MCGQKFELKIDNVRFVGHPTLLQHAPGQVSVSWGGSPWADVAHAGLGPPGQGADTGSGEGSHRAADLTGACCQLHPLRGPEGPLEKEMGGLPCLRGFRPCPQLLLFALWVSADCSLPF